MKSFEQSALWVIMLCCAALVCLAMLGGCS